MGLFPSLLFTIRQTIPTSVNVLSANNILPMCAGPCHIQGKKLSTPHTQTTSSFSVPYAGTHTFHNLCHMSHSNVNYRTTFPVFVSVTKYFLLKIFSQIRFGIHHTHTDSKGFHGMYSHANVVIPVLGQSSGSTSQLMLVPGTSCHGRRG